MFTSWHVGLSGQVDLLSNWHAMPYRLVIESTCISLNNHHDNQPIFHWPVRLDHVDPCMKPTCLHIAVDLTNRPFGASGSVDQTHEVLYCRPLKSRKHLHFFLIVYKLTITKLSASCWIGWDNRQQTWPSRPLREPWMNCIHIQGHESLPPSKPKSTLSSPKIITLHNLTIQLF